MVENLNAALRSYYYNGFWRLWMLFFFLEKDDRRGVLAALSSGESEALFIGRAATCVTRCVEGRRN